MADRKVETMDDKARQFLQSEFGTLSLNGAFQRAQIYTKKPKPETTAQ